MPFGISSIPLILKDFIYQVLRDMLGKVAYIDETLIYSPTLEGHIDHVRAFLLELLKHQFYFKGEKCYDHLFLGYIISQNGIHMDDKKGSHSMAGFTHGETSLTLSRICDFYILFIENFSSIATPAQYTA